MNKFGDKKFSEDSEPIAKSEAITIASQFPRPKWDGKSALFALLGPGKTSFGKSAEKQVEAYDKSAEEYKSFVKSPELVVRQFAESWGDALNLIGRARSYGSHTLDLSGLGLTNLPAEIGDLPNLRHLNLRNNYLARLPESISQLKNLHSLDLSNNQLSSLPKSIGELRNLVHLNLNDNYLWSLPESVGQLQQLRSLDLKANLFPALPDSILNLKRLQRTELFSNDLTNLLNSFLQLSLPERLDELSSLISGLQQLRSKWSSEENTRDLTADDDNSFENYRLRDIKEVKLVLVGRGGCGKTSIVKQLVGRPFNKFQQETIGLEITPLVIPINSQSGKEDIQLNIWDFGGQEFFQPAIPVFFTHNSIYLVVLSGREGLENDDAHYWLNLIKVYGGQSPIIVVLNKIRDHSSNINLSELRKKYPAIRALIETDCADNTNIDDLRKTIAQETEAVARLGKDFPIEWRKIKNRLNVMRKNKFYITLNEYQSICNIHGEKETGNQEHLAKCLHEMGTLHNFIENPRLRDTYVLNPAWLAGVIYKLFNNVNLRKELKGEIWLSHLRYLFVESDFPSSTHVFIFDLLKKFDLCLTITDSNERDEHYLIAHLLDTQEPEGMAEFILIECLNFEYHYSMLYQNLLPRYIVEAYHMMEGELRWRTGMVVQFEGCKAMVKGDGKNKVAIHVKGPAASSRRRLLAAIRSDFEKIHLDFGKLEPLEMVPLPKYPGEVVSYKKLQALEQRGDEQFTEFVGDNLIELNVKEMLHGVDLEGARKSEREPNSRKKRPRLFISYSHKDENKRKKLGTHLKLMQRMGKIENWHDRLIRASENWRNTIDDELEKADIVLLLVSADFLASDYCYEIEMTRALERHTIGETRVIPIIVRDVSWSQAPFAHLQVLPKDGLPVTQWPDRDMAWRNVSEGIEKVVNEICENREWA